MVVKSTLYKQDLNRISSQSAQKGAVFKMGKVNLDALVPREDLEIETDIKQDIANSTTTLPLSQLELKGNFFYPNLRKPEYQRETNEWNPEKVLGLIESFVNGDLIPAIILWTSKGNYTFVIDGAHRLGALIAWVNDDYGDGEISRNFFGNISDEQKKIAIRTKKLVDSKIKSYLYLKQVAENPKGAEQIDIERARELGKYSLQLQWLIGDVEKAENSFFKINQEATKINKTELTLLKSRDYPNGIAARAIKNGGQGHKYWHNFNEENQKKVQELAKEINELLFIPHYKKPINTLELPIADRSDSAQTLSLILNFVNITNKVKEKEKKKDKKNKNKEDVKDVINKDNEGIATLEYLSKCKNIASKIRSRETSSLGLHPAIYLYARDGTYRTGSFYAIVALMLDFENDELLQKRFFEVRKDFESIITEYNDLIYQIFRKYREGIKGFTHVKNFYIKIINGLSKKKSPKELMDKLIEAEKKEGNIAPKDFTIKAKSTIFIKEAVEKSLKCKICGGLIDSKSITIDHIQRKRDGGLGIIDNGQIAHPYCNSVIKN